MKKVIVAAVIGAAVLFSGCTYNEYYMIDQPDKKEAKIIKQVHTVKIGNHVISKTVGAKKKPCDCAKQNVQFARH